MLEDVAMTPLSGFVRPLRGTTKITTTKINGSRELVQPVGANALSSGYNHLICKNRPTQRYDAAAVPDRGALSAAKPIQ